MSSFASKLSEVGSAHSDFSKFPVLKEVLVRKKQEVAARAQASNATNITGTNTTEPNEKPPADSEASFSDTKKVENLFDILASEGNGVMVQGLPQVRTEIDGQDSIGADNGKALSWEDVPQEIMAGVSVQKSPTANLIEGALGGTVNIRTKLPFQLPPSKAAFSVKSEYASAIGETAPSGSVFYSDQRELGGGRVGYLINLSRSESRSFSESIQLEPFIRREDIVEAPVYVPHGVSWREAKYSHRRNGLYLASQWAPTENLGLFAKVHSSRYDMDWDERGASLKADEYDIKPRDGSAFSYHTTGVFESGSLASSAWRGELDGEGVRIDGATQMANRKAKTLDTKIGFDLAYSNNLSLKGQIQHTSSNTNTVNLTLFNSTYIDDFKLDLKEKKPSIEIGNAENIANRSDYFWNAAMDKLDNNKAQLNAVSLDGILTVDESRWVTSMWGGIRVMSRADDINDAGYNWGSISDHWNTPLKYMDTNRPDLSELHYFGDFIHSDGVRTGMVLPASYFAANYELVSSVVRNEIKSGQAESAEDVESGWIPSQYSLTDQSKLKLKTLAAYFMLKLANKGDLPWPMDGDVGLRVVQSRHDILGYGKFNLLENESLDDDARAFGDGDFFLVSHTNRETHLLPSLNLRFILNANLDWRISSAKTMARANIQDYKAYTQVNAELETIDDDTTIVRRWYGEGGNPRLKARTSEEFDTSLEWAFNEGGSVYATYFFKSLSNLIVSEVEEEVFENNGISQTVELERPRNADKGHLTGLELGYQQSYEFLPGVLQFLSAEMNVTYMDSAADTKLAKELAPIVDIPLEGVSEYQYKIAGQFQRGRYSARASYRWRSDYLESTSDVNTGRITWHDHYAQLDMSAAYEVSDTLSVRFNAANLLDDVRTKKIGPFKYQNGNYDPHVYNRSWRKSDRRYSLTLLGKF